MQANQLIDRASQVRPGEELDIDAVDNWLKAHIADLHGDVSVTQYSGGASNWTYCLAYQGQEIILRRAPAGTKAKGAHDMGREYRVQAALKDSYAYVPKMLAFCPDPSVIGSEFYAMEKLTGIIPRKNFPRGIKLDKQTTRQCCINVLNSLIELHQVDWRSTDMTALSKGEGYAQRQISGWSERFRRAKTWNVPAANYVMDWLQNNLPAEEKICVIHNDFRLDNVVLDEKDITRVRGVLDWEMATLGDPLMDLGNSLAYWVEQRDDFMAQNSRRQPTHLDGMLTRREVVEYYVEKTGFAIENFKFYEVYGLFRLAAIAQQIYFRYYQRQTANPAFKRFWIFVHYLLWRSKRAIKRKGM
jgi:aminoglycoside phosphotransferase (APT) family kinase protein